MKLLLTPLCAAATLCAPVQAQFYKLHNVDLAGGAIGQFSPTLHSTPGSTISNSATQSFGGVFSLRDHPFSFAGVEFNYAYTDFSERYTALNAAGALSYTARTKTDMHEATAAYLFHPHFRNFQPFVGIGGGGLDFVPTTASNQWRGAGLLEAGFDIPTSNPHFGFRAEGRALFYRAPNYGQANLASRQWVATTEPSFGVYYRF